MRLYTGMSKQFFEDTTRGLIANKLRDAFFTNFRYYPPESEVRSWRNSLRAMTMLMQGAGLNDQGVILEYQLPQTSKRLDCMLCGTSDAGKAGAVVVELKQWEKAGPAEGERLVTTFVGGGNREVLHPSVQVHQYRRFLQDFHTAFSNEPPEVGLDACAYLHNYQFVEDDVLLSDRYREYVAQAPVFAEADVDGMSEYLVKSVGDGSGKDVLRTILDGEYRPSRKLLDHVAAVIEGTAEFTLLDEQLVVFDKVIGMVRRGLEADRKEVVLVHGGPGTGKSVIAINLMAHIARLGFDAQYATGSKAFTETLRKIVGTRASTQFKYFNSYMTANKDAVDVVISDEAHRIREASHNRFTPKAARTDKPQVEELITSSKVPVFFIDDRQVVRPGEIGSSAYIKEHAERLGCSVSEYKLTAQFRCAGSEAFVGWVDNTLGIERTPHVIWEGDELFEVRICDSVEELEERILQKHREGASARLVAGFCWPWSKAQQDGTLVDDVQIGNWKRPWNARPEATKLATGIPKAPLWAKEPGGIQQVGCVYTAQGFEFDYVGVIFGSDLRYDMAKGKWVADKKANHDSVVKRSGEAFEELVKNTYRVLMTRGLKGCYLYFCDRGTESFLRSRMTFLERVAED